MHHYTVLHCNIATLQHGNTALHGVVMVCSHCFAAGAWQDVTSRKSLSLGWTYQHAYILAHRAQIVRGNRHRTSATNAACKHYVLHGTFDAYEVDAATNLHGPCCLQACLQDWSTINTAPGKLRWGAWAWNLAAYRNGSHRSVLATAVVDVSLIDR